MKKKLTLLIFTACAVFVGSVGLIFWALAATQVNVTSGLLVTYTPTPQVVCDTSATYQRTNDSSAIAFKNGNLSFGYGGTTTDATLEATTNALQLDDSNTYVVFEFTFQNKNLMENYDLTITLTDNGTATNMTRKYYFGDLSSSNISAKRTTIKNSGIDNSSLSSKKLVLGYQETGRIYMLLEITPGTVASYLADNTNKFAFTLTTAEHVEAEKVSYLNKNWAKIICNAPSNASMFYEGSTQQTILGVKEPMDGDTILYNDIIFTKDASLITGLTHSVSVGTLNETSSSAYTPTEGIDDVIAYWGNDKADIVIYSPSTIYAPQDSSYLFSEEISNDYRLTDLSNLNLSNLDTSKVTNMRGMFNSCSSLTSLDISNFDTSNVTNMGAIFSGCSSLTSLDLGNFNLTSCTTFGSLLYGCSALTSITLPYNLKSGKTITLPASTYYNGSAGPYSEVGRATSGTTVACSTASSKVTLTKH